LISALGIGGWCGKSNKSHVSFFSSGLLKFQLFSSEIAGRFRCNLVNIDGIKYALSFNLVER